MRAPNRLGWAAAVAAVAIPTAWALAQAPATNAPARTRNMTAAVIDSHQIDRFEAIRQLQAQLKDRPDNVADWIILGELAHEVALDLPADQDDAYYRMSADAYQRALRLDPNNAGLKAAVQFAREQEAGAKDFDAARQRAVPAYLAARRLELQRTSNAPTVQVYAPVAASALANPDIPPTPTPTVPTNPAIADPVPRGNNPASPPVTTVTTIPAYAGPVYQPYAPASGQPLTYSSYANSYVPAYNAAAPPMTLRQLGSQIPRALANEGVQNIPR